jgi:hypothetical protein
MASKYGFVFRKCVEYKGQNGFVIAFLIESPSHQQGDLRTSKYAFDKSPIRVILVRFA